MASCRNAIRVAIGDSARRGDAAMATIQQQITDNLDRVRQRIETACTRCDRASDDIQLIAVSKYVDVPVVESLVAAGCTQLGESRPQQLWEKAAALAKLPITWHMIGHLQRNKVARTLPLVSLIHSVDSIRLAKTIDQQAAELGRTAEVLIEVNVSGDAAKHGFMAEELEARLIELAELRHLSVRGLMTMASREGGTDRARSDFASLRKLRDAVKPNLPAEIDLAYLSMGMSRDFEEAICEGATHIRVGSTLFDGIN